MGSAAAAPQPHGAGEAKDSRTAGHILGPGAAHLSAPGPENGPDPERQQKKDRRKERREEGLGPGKGRGSENERLSDGRACKDGERLEPKHPLPPCSRAVTLAQPHFGRRRHGNTAGTRGAGSRGWKIVRWCFPAAARPFSTVVWLLLDGSGRAGAKGIWLLAADLRPQPAYPQAPGSEDHQRCWGKESSLVQASTR